MTLRAVKRYPLHIATFLVLLSQILSVSTGLEARVSLKVDGNGFHRTLIYQVDFGDFIENCHAAIYLELPPALYVNVDELADLRRQKVSTACSVGETDVELFMETARSQNVTICGPLTANQIALTLPIHQRYRYPKENGEYATVVLPKPKVLLGCKERIKEHRVSKIDLCSPCVELVPKWREIPYFMDKEDHVWVVPIGDSSMLTIVTYATLFTTILGAMFITRTVWRCVPERREKRD